ncbi:hypothetical protein K7432_016187 [Basidiobolus ranarum]|uniref:Carrier domain-containing protein n=1 Tax=Basidiobolus ranarum TaxID=34480 RepID=A0ABR2WF24_9FUNG
MPLSRMPINSSGKIDRKMVVTVYNLTSLDDLLAFSTSDNGEYVGASTPEEENWLQLWTKVLNLAEKRIGVHDSFFSLGGDSIIAVKLVGAARQFGYELSVQQLYEQLTIGELAANTVLIHDSDAELEAIEKYALLKLDSEQLEHLFDTDLVQNEIDPSQVTDVYPCSPLQEGLIALGLQDNSSYLTQQVYRCEVSIDKAQFKSAWQSVIRTNPILRSTIVFSNSGYSHLSGLQVVLAEDSIDWNEIELSGADVSESQLSDILTTDLSRGIQVGKLLSRFTLVSVEGSPAYFIWTIHHALYDGWSMSLVVEDLVKAYQMQELASRPSYNNFIKFTSGVDKDESLGYWKNLLANVEVTHLAKQSSNSREIKASRSIIEDIQVDFSSLTSKHNITIATIANLAWSLVVKAHSGNSDVVFGVVNSGRNLPVAGIENICGPCFNTLPVRVTLDDNHTVLDMLRTIHKTQMEQHRYQSLGLQDIIKCCVDERIHSLFDSLLVVQNLPSEDFDGGIESIGLKELKTTMPANYPIVVELGTLSKDCQLSLTYDEDTIPSDDAQWMFNHLKTALSEIVKNVNVSVNDFSVISAEESALLQSWSVSNTGKPHYSCVHTEFENQVGLTPDNVAVQFETSEFVTYKQLNDRANRLAHHIIEFGVERDSVFPLCLDKSVTMIVAMLAVLKAGGAYVPLDPNNPIERNRYIISETKARVVLTFNRYQHYFEGQELILLDRDEEVAETYPTENPVISGLTPSSLCYVLFTSGSTGTPKGVMLEHLAIVNFIYAQQDVWNIDSTDTILQFANYTFDASIMDIFIPLSVGARVALAPKESLLTDLEGNMNKMKVTSMMLTPTLASHVNPLNVPSMKRLMLGGEMVTAAVRNTWAPHVELSNGYGPTEAAVANILKPNLTEHSSCSNVGKPSGNNRIYILGPDLRLVPLGVVGELCISGSQLARGYLNRPDLTEAAFVSSPFISGERIYRTGDLARFNNDGSVELIGRKDNQIKLHGLRIELDEIEHALYEHWMVGRACVLPLVTDSTSNHKALC